MPAPSVGQSRGCADRRLSPGPPSPNTLPQGIVQIFTREGVDDAVCQIDGLSIIEDVIGDVKIALVIQGEASYVTSDACAAGPPSPVGTS